MNGSLEGISIFDLGPYRTQRFLKSIRHYERMQNAKSNTYRRYHTEGLLSAQHNLLSPDAKPAQRLGKEQTSPYYHPNYQYDERFPHILTSAKAGQDAGTTQEPQATDETNARQYSCCVQQDCEELRCTFRGVIILFSKLAMVMQRTEGNHIPRIQSGPRYHS